MLLLPKTFEIILKKSLNILDNIKEFESITKCITTALKLIGSIFRLDDSLFNIRIQNTTNQK